MTSNVMSLVDWLLLSYVWDYLPKYTPLSVFVKHNLMPVCNLQHKMHTRPHGHGHGHGHANLRISCV